MHPTGFLTLIYTGRRNSQAVDSGCTRAHPEMRMQFFHASSIAKARKICNTTHPWGDFPVPRRPDPAPFHFICSPLFQSFFSFFFFFFCLCCFTIPRCATNVLGSFPNRDQLVDLFVMPSRASRWLVTIFAGRAQNSTGSRRARFTPGASTPSELSSKQPARWRAYAAHTPLAASTVAAARPDTDTKSDDGISTGCKFLFFSCEF